MAIRRPPLGERLARGKVIAVLRASHISALAPVCDVLVEEGILGLELTLTTPGILGALPEMVDRYADGEMVQSRMFTVTPVDTVGAGDGFAAGYLAAFLAGARMQDRVDQGAAVGALVTTRRGDMTAMPQREEVDALINSTHPN